MPRIGISDLKGRLASGNSNKTFSVARSSRDPTPGSSEVEKISTPLVTNKLVEYLLQILELAWINISADFEAISEHRGPHFVSQHRRFRLTTLATE